MKRDLIGYAMLAFGLMSFFGGITVVTDGHALGWGGLGPGAALVGASYVALRTAAPSAARPAREDEAADSLDT